MITQCPEAALYISKCSMGPHRLCCLLHVCKSKDFAQQINLNMDNCWGIVRALVDLCLNLDEGKYLLVKEPNKPIIRLYNVPGDSFTLEQVGYTFTLPGPGPQWLTIQQALRCHLAAKLAVLAVSLAEQGVSLWHIHT